MRGAGYPFRSPPMTRRPRSRPGRDLGSRGRSSRRPREAGSPRAGWLARRVEALGRNRLAASGGQCNTCS
jgi:hypothetical protein